MNEHLTFNQFCEEIPDEQKPWLDRDGLGWPKTRWAHEWNGRGVLIRPNFIPHSLIDAYVSRYEATNGSNSKTGFPSGTPYMRVEEIKNVCLYKPLVHILNSLIGEEMGMNLNLTDWVSTERNWHQDDYLNPPHVNGHYLAVWIALDDIHPDSGVFEFVPGSHKWPVMRGEKVKAMLTPEEQQSPNWPRTAERFLDDIFEAEIEKRGAKVERWDNAKKGDVLIWHAWLAHRGSKPKNPDLLRKSLICHYSGIHHRPDMQPPVHYHQTINGSEIKGFYFPF